MKMFLFWCYIQFDVSCSVGTQILVVQSLVDQQKTWHSRLQDSYRMVVHLLTTIWYVGLSIVNSSLFLHCKIHTEWWFICESFLVHVQQFNSCSRNFGLSLRSHFFLIQYHGGTNFGRTSGGLFIATSYDYDAPLDEYGMK